MDKPNKPVLSICIPTYNRAERVLSCVKNILMCSSDKIQVVVSNNASTDNTLELLSAIDDDRLIIYTNEKNIGGPLNWPLAISRASGQWAALMSDEDIVRTYSLPIFLEMLERISDNNDKNVGAVVYTIPPFTWITSDYISQSPFESLWLANVYGGNITCHIINMDFFHLETEEFYLEYGFVTERGWPADKIRVAEPQWEVLLQISLRANIMLTKHSLCRYGGNEISEKIEANNEFNPDLMGGRSLLRHETQFNAMLNKAIYLADFVSRYDKYDQHFVATLLGFLGWKTGATAAFTNRVISGTEIFRPQIFKNAQQYFNFTKEDKLNLVCQHTYAYIEKIRDTITPDAMPVLNLVTKELKNVLSGDVNGEIPKELTGVYRIVAGSYFFLSYIKFNNYSVLENGRVIDYYLDDFDDTIQLKETDKVYECLRGDRDYLKVVNNSEIAIFRIHYLKGEAYFRLGDFENAALEFEKFLDAIENATTIIGIMTGVKGVISTYYFLQMIYSKFGDVAKAESCKMIRIQLQDATFMHHVVKELNILFLGGSGFIGKNILDLLRQSYRVVSPSHDELDLLDSEQVRQYLSINKFDVVINAAMPTGNNDLAVKNDLFQLSIKAFSNLASCSDLYGKMIYIGSGAEYGKQREIAQISEEWYTSVVPTDDYGLSRYVMNQIASVRGNIYNLRLFGCCGAGDPSYKLIPYIASCVSQGKSLVLREDRMIDYLYVEDLAEILRYFIETVPRHKAYNVCSGNALLVSDIAKEVMRQLKSDTNITFECQELGYEYTGSNKRLREEITTWQSTPMKEAIQRILLKENFI